ncbi:Tex family protein [Gallionella capsiferriformans]|uniref:Tex-like protein-like n=1 Tax=Gallionella capsiferriformans (strain ES-2) TaxID=395494 RepID=D9SH56_GALCS|nr:Tex family protein [Gallionella capsiferriformans]ADL55853.1 Tex-like protein-like [Gallionella capsiferriformans ES-2]
MLPSIEHRLANELGARPAQVAAAIALLDEGATVPFISRYRKEATGGLDDIQLRLLDDRLSYLRELEARRAAIIESVTTQNKMTPQLLDAIMHAADKTHLEDLYLPYKLKRRTRAQIALEAGLGALADALLRNPALHPEQEAAGYLKAAFSTDQGDNPGVLDAKSALDGARQILMERFSEDAALLQALREYVLDHGVVEARVIEEKKEAAAKYSDYFDYSESIKTIPSHRTLAILRGRREGLLNVQLRLDTEADKPLMTAPYNPCEARIAARFGVAHKMRPADNWLADTVRYTWRVKIFLHLETELMSALRIKADTDAISVFALNLKALLLAAPAGPRTTMGLDPGVRTGVKVAVVDETGRVLDTCVIYPHQPRCDWEGSLHTLAKLAEKHRVSLIATGNGTASRETDKLALDLIRLRPELKLINAVVSEAGASVYSASEFASKELPDMDVSLRGAVSIARRLQDPLAELVKIDPKAIGVGQYQHDVSQSQLARSLNTVVEDCVNAVGVDVNTASAPLLARVSGLNNTVAQNIVAHRDSNGRFATRAQLLEVPRLGKKAFEQAAGFLRITGGSNPLDASTVHPESYPLVKRILNDIKLDLKGVIGNSALLSSLNPARYQDEKFGLPTITDILRELDKPGHDPRPEFTTATFREGIEKISDLQPDMILEGVVTNVAAFGAFVDIGVHQDGLVHISALANSFVKDPHTVVKAGQIVKVKVLEVDEKRKRIALTMRLADAAPKADAKPRETKRPPVHRGQEKSESVKMTTPNVMAAAFSKLKA